jgi:hypothetical protein
MTLKWRSPTLMTQRPSSQRLASRMPFFFTRVPFSLRIGRKYLGAKGGPLRSRLLGFLHYVDIICFYITYVYIYKYIYNRYIYICILIDHDWSFLLQRSLKTWGQCHWFHISLYSHMGVTMIIPASPEKYDAPAIIPRCICLISQFCCHVWSVFNSFHLISSNII